MMKHVDTDVVALLTELLSAKRDEHYFVIRWWWNGHSESEVGTCRSPNLSSAAKLGPPLECPV
jgi:hypothetical protein